MLWGTNVLNQCEIVQVHDQYQIKFFKVFILYLARTQFGQVLASTLGMLLRSLIRLRIRKAIVCAC